MTTIGWSCELSLKEFRILQKLCNKAFDCDEFREINIKQGRKFTELEGAEINLSKLILDYVLSAYSIYKDTQTKTIPIDYEYVSKNLDIIENIHSTLTYPDMYCISRYIGKKQIDEGDKDIEIPLFLCNQKRELIKDKNNTKR